MNILNIRKKGVPLVAIATTEPASTITSCIASLMGSPDGETPVMQWDLLRGLTGINTSGATLARALSPGGAIDSNNPGSAIECLLKTDDQGTPVCISAICFFHLASRFLDNEQVLQGIWLLRDFFKSTGSTLIMLSPAFNLPPEIARDIVSLTEPLPTVPELEKTLGTICLDAGLPVPTGPEKEKVTDALLGLSSFEAEQALALSTRPEGIDLIDLWDRKRQMIKSTRGCTVYSGDDSFDKIGGCSNVKNFLLRVLRGRNAPAGIPFIDEIEKYLAGNAGDTSGVSQDIMATLLTFMQDEGASGMIFIGPPGAAKSAIAKAAGNEVKIPTIGLDFGATKASLVGQSEQNVRAMLATVKAVTQGKMLFIVTCNSFGALPPELKRRFTLGTFFFDLPDATERAAIWSIYRKKYELQADNSPVSDEGWTGAEIKACCDISWRLQCPLSEASSFIVPVAKSASKTIEDLRTQASGKFISASYSGVYQHDSTPVKQPSRKISNN